MRGIIFRTYLDFIKDRFGYVALDSLLSEHEYPNKGGFSTAGNYSSAYLKQLVQSSTPLFENSPERVLEEFGRYAFHYLVKMFKHSYEGANTVLDVSNAYDFLENLNVIHFDELKKIYPDAKFPKFAIERVAQEHILIEYASPRDIPSIVYGLIRGCLEYYHDDSTLSMQPTPRHRIINDTKCPIYVFEVKHDG